MNGAEAIVDCLAAAGVRRTFGVGGESVLALMDAIEKHDDQSYTAVRHESAGGLAADGYARTHRRPAACLGHVGAGATNLVNGVANAYKDSVPIVALLGNAETDVLGRDVWHEVDHLGIFEPITKLSTRVDRPERIPQVMRTVTNALNTGATGPVVLDVPADVAGAELDADTEAALAETLDAEPTFVPAASRPEPSEEVLDAVARGFQEAEFPAVLAGGGVRWSGASDRLQALVDTAGVPVITTLTGRGAVPESNELCFGALGIFGRKSAKEVADRVDFLLAVGTELSDNETFEWTAFSDAEIVQVNVDSGALNDQYDVDLPVHADARAFLEALRERLAEIEDAGTEPPGLEPCRDAFAEEIDAVTDPDPDDLEDTDSDRVNPHAILAGLADVMAPEDVLCTGAGQHSLWANLLPIDRPGGFCKSAGLGTMGYALSAGLGAAVDSDGTAFVAVGDGDIAMVVQELWTCADEDADVVVVVFNDEQLSAIKNPQSARYDRRIGVDYGAADFAAVAEGFGATGIRVESGAAFADAVERAVDVDGPVVLDVLVDPEVQAPSFFYEYQ
jgi:acetolactate synthase-1/2/3 large subunit